MKKIGGALAGLLVIFGGFWGLAQAEKQRKAVAAAPPVVLVEEGEPETPIVQAPTFASYEDLKDKLRQRAEPYAGSTGVADAVLEGDRFWDLAVENSLENEPEAIRLAGYAFQCYYAALRHHDLPNDMIFVPPGPVFMPGGQELFVGAYFIDRSEVSLGRYRDFVRREADFDLPPRFEGYSADYDSYPICDVTGVEAMAFAAATGAMLPTDAQWSRAASYSDDDEKSWPNPPTQIGSSPRYNVDYATDFPQPIQAFSNDRSYFGCYDIVGNVSEWTRSSSDENPGFGSMMVVRGGDFSRPFVSPEDARFSMRFDYRAETVGFRCVIEIPSTPAAIAYQLDQ